MIPKNQDANQGDLFKSELRNALNKNHALYQMSELINWQNFEKEFSKFYCAINGRPGLSIRLMVSLEYLKQMTGLSDEEVVEKWFENPYWQYFSGEEYFQIKYPIDASSMVRFRKRIKKEGVNLLLKETISLGLKTKTIKKNSFKKVIVDTTVQEKNIAYPLDAKSQNKVREHLVKFAKKAGIKLRQSYEKLSPRNLFKGAKYAHARQMKGAKKNFKKVKVYLGRVIRDVENKWDFLKSEVKTVLQKEYEQLMAIAKVLFDQSQKSKKKIYSVHEPQVECISKGKVHKKYEFGTKVSVGVTHKEGFVLVNEAFHGNPYDGHTLSKSLEIIEKNTKVLPKECYVDKGYKGHKVKNVKVYQSAQKRGVTSWIRQKINRRSMIEGMISHQKRKCHLGKNYLYGIQGDQNNAILSGAGHNLRLISNKLVLA